MNDLEAVKLLVEEKMGDSCDIKSITVYKDQFTGEESILVGYKGKQVTESGIIFCPYIKPKWYVRLWTWLMSKFGKKLEAVPLSGDSKDAHRVLFEDKEIH